jgi:hypothetical protein
MLLHARGSDILRAKQRYCLLFLVLLMPDAGRSGSAGCERESGSHRDANRPYLNYNEAIAPYLCGTAVGCE